MNTIEQNNRTKEQPNIKTRLGQALYGLGERIDEIANRETNLSHRQVWLGTGALALIGAYGIAEWEAAKFSGEEIRLYFTDSPGFKALGKQSYELWEKWYNYTNNAETNVGGLAEAITRGDLIADGKTFLSPEGTANITSNLLELAKIKQVPRFLEGMLLLVTASAGIVNVLSTKAKKPVKISGPVGKFPGVLPGLAKFSKALAEML
ncbi:hypothetical protein DRH14_03340 [Candidatus Shapirobacteria bacterium]|nr:MAG: hypothetical protein DRH14_03340 [Candidatus Shapirobacteria bacterium]